MRCDRAEWARLVNRLFFNESVCDRVRSSIISAGDHVCSQCNDKSKFATRQGLLQHFRMEHGLRNPARVYVGQNGICPGCKTNFRQRFRAISHLSDARRPKCMQRMLAGEFPQVGSLEFIARLDEADSACRRNAHQNTWKGLHKQNNARNMIIYANPFPNRACRRTFLERHTTRFQQAIELT